MKTNLPSIGAALLAVLTLSALITAIPAHAGPGYALSFDGVDDWVDMQAAVIPTSGDFTVECWVRCPTAPNSLREILSQGSSGNAFYIGTDPANNFRLGDTWVSTGLPFPVGGWHHLAVVKSSTNTMVYLDGTNRLNKGSAIANPAAASGLRLGRQYGSIGEYWRGQLDEVRIWNEARSAEQLRANMHQPPTGTEPNLAAYWPFREGLASDTTADASGHGHTGRLLNRPRWVPSPVGWASTLQLLGPNPLTNECHAAFLEPGAIPLASPVSLAAGYFHSLALRPDGTVVGWGRNDYGQANSAVAGSNVVAIEAGGAHSLALKAGGTVVGWGHNYFGQANGATAGSNVVAIAAGDSHSLALKPDGTVVGWGDNDYGQANGAAAGSNVVAIAAGAVHSLALKADGTVVGWGYNGYGQANGAAAGSNVVAIAAGGAYSLALKADGTVVGWGYNDYGQANGAVAGSNVVAIVAGYYHGLALKADGTVVGWGINDYGQANSAAAGSNVVAIVAGYYHGLALKADGTVVGWGDNGSGQVTIPASVSELNLPVTVTGAVDTNTPATYLLTYSTTNNLGVGAATNRTVLVVDSTPPSLLLNGANPLALAVNSPLAEPGATASDTCAGDLTGSILITGAVNTNVVGSYTLTYTATDPSGNTTSSNRTVLVCNQPSLGALSAFVVATNSATGTRAALLNAAVNPNGLPTTVFFQYGLNTAYAGSNAPVNLPAGFADTNLLVSLDSLAFGATYHWRVLASNSLGVTTSPDQQLVICAPFARGDFNGDGTVDVEEFETVRQNYWQANPPRFTGLTGLGQGTVQFGLTNPGSPAFTVLASTNLVHWQVLSNSIQPRYLFQDPDAAQYPHRFYRLRWP